MFSAAIRLRGTSFWNVLIFLLEASVFMLIGSSLRDVIDRVGGFGVVVEQMTVPILWILLALTLARFAWIFACDGDHRAASRPRLATLRDRWAGVRRRCSAGPACAASSRWPSR